MPVQPELARGGPGAARSRAGRGRPRITRNIVGGVIVAAYMLASAVAVAAHAALPVPEWLALHLLVLGAATNAVFVWSRFFAQSLLHSQPRAEWPAQVRLGVLNAGVISALAGVSGDLPWLAVAGAVVVGAAVAAHVASMVSMAWSAARGRTLRVVAWYYVSGGAALIVGCVLGGLMASGAVHSAGMYTAILLTHAQLNLLGWLGLAIIGTQFMLWPMVLRTRMSEDAPGTARRVLLPMAGGLAVMATALLGGSRYGAAHWLAAGGMACYLAGAVMSFRPAAAEMRVKPPHTAAAWALLAGNGWLVVALMADTAGLAAGPGQAEQVLERLLVPVLGVGVAGQILMGALTFLLPVTVGGGPAGNRRMAAVLDSGWRTRAVATNAGVLVIAVLPVRTGWPMIAAWVAILAGLGTFPLLAGAAMVAVRGTTGGPGSGSRAAPGPGGSRAGAPEPGTG